jgi:hypothetical protein
MRSRRDNPEPFSSTSSGALRLLRASQRRTASAACAIVAGGAASVVASVRKICRAITLFESLLTSRTMSHSGGDSSVANGIAPRGASPLRKPPAKRPPAARKYVSNIA